MKKRKIILPIVMLLLLIIATIGVTYAAFTFTKEGTVENTLETSTIMLTYTEGKTGITLNEAYPMSDDKGKALVGENNVFDFTVQAALSKSTIISYEVTAIKIPITDVTPLKDNEVKLYLERAIDPDITYQEVLSPSNFVPIENQTEVGSPVGSMILDSGSFTNEGTTIHNYRLRMWVDENAQIPNGESRKYGVKINVYAKQIILEPTDESCFTFDETTGTIKSYQSKCPKNVVIPSTIQGNPVLTIGPMAFQNLQITKVYIPDGITVIEGQAFLANQLTEVSIPDSVVQIGNLAFQSNQLKKVTLPKNLEVLGDAAFKENELTKITLPGSLTNIGGYLFANNRSPLHLVISEGIKTLSNRTFDSCNLVKVELPNTLTEIGYGVFNKNQLTEVNIPSNVTTIGEYAFSSNLIHYLSLPEGLKSIGGSAFNTNQLTEVIIPSTVEKMGNYVFVSSPDLRKIVNKTNRAFSWGLIISGTGYGGSFVTGTLAGDFASGSVNVEIVGES